CRRTTDELLYALEFRYSQDFLIVNDHGEIVSRGDSALLMEASNQLWNDAVAQGTCTHEIQGADRLFFVQFVGSREMLLRSHPSCQTPRRLFSGKHVWNDDRFSTAHIVRDTSDSFMSCPGSTTKRRIYPEPFELQAHHLGYTVQSEYAPEQLR